MSKHCGGGCNCNRKNEFSETAAKNESKNNRSRKYSVKYRIDLNKVECEEEEFIERIKSYQGIVDEVEFTEEELIISYDDRLIKPSELEKIVS